MNKIGPFAQTIINQKYAKKLPNGNRETWEEISHRVAKHVVAPYSEALANSVELLIANRQLMPGGRFLYAAGLPYPQTNNCMLFRAKDSREGWGDLFRRVAVASMTGAGVGVEYSQIRPKGELVGGMGGVASGPVPLAIAVNDVGRQIKQGGDRRVALWAGLNWSHPDQKEFQESKNWPTWLREQKELDFNTPAPLDGTNISTGLDDEFFRAYSDPLHPMHKVAREVYWRGVRLMVSTAEPGFSINVGDHAGEDLRNAPVTADTQVLTDRGYVTVGSIVGKPTTVWTGKQFAPDVVFRLTGANVPTVLVRMTGGRFIQCDPSHPFLVERWSGKGKYRKLRAIDRVRADELRKGDTLHVSLPTREDTEIVDNRYYTLGYVYGDGSFNGAHAEVTICDPAKRVCIHRLETMPHTSNPEDGRGYYRIYYPDDGGFWKGRFKTLFPQDVKEGSTDRVVSFLAGLFDADGNYEPKQKRIRLSSVRYAFLRDVARCLESIGILAHISKGGKGSYAVNDSWQLVIAAEYNARFAALIPTLRLKPDGGYVAYRDSTVKVVSVEDAGLDDVFCADVKVEEHSFQAEGVIISNCTEVTSRTDNDICNLASLNLARFKTLEEFAGSIYPAVGLLLCNTLYAKLPFQELEIVRDVNRRIGLGLMGLHEWLLIRGYPYGPCSELATWLDVWANETDRAARVWACKLGVNVPIATRAIAPTGTIAIVAETTSGIEPIFASAYKRRYLKGTSWHYQYVIDAAAKRVLDAGVHPDAIEDAYDLSRDVERRIAFQAFVQRYVDQGISSTINLPQWGSEYNNEGTVKKFGEILFPYLTQLRGITAYPDGSRGGQPLNKVPLSEAIGKEGVEIEENGNSQSCVSGVCGV